MWLIYIFLDRKNLKKRSSGSLLWWLFMLSIWLQDLEYSIWVGWNIQRSNTWGSMGMSGAPASSGSSTSSTSTSSASSTSASPGSATSTSTSSGHQHRQHHLQHPHRKQIIIVIVVNINIVSTSTSTSWASATSSAVLFLVRSLHIFLGSNIYDWAFTLRWRELSRGSTRGGGGGLPWGFTGIYGGGGGGNRLEVTGVAVFFNLSIPVSDIFVELFFLATYNLWSLFSYFLQIVYFPGVVYH